MKLIENKRIMRDISVSHRLLKMLYGEIQEKFNVNSHSPMYFFTINNSPGISQEEVSKRTGSDKATTARAVKKLEEANIIIRKKDLTDGRAYKLYPTDLAKALEEELISKTSEIENILLEGLSDEETETLVNLLHKIGDNARDVINNRKCGNSPHKRGR